MFFLCVNSNDPKEMIFNPNFKMTIPHNFCLMHIFCFLFLFDSVKIKPFKWKKHSHAGNVICHPSELSVSLSPVCSVIHFDKHILSGWCHTSGWTLKMSSFPVQFCQKSLVLPTKKFQWAHMFIYTASTASNRLQSVAKDRSPSVNLNHCCRGFTLCLRPANVLGHFRI